MANFILYLRTSTQDQILGIEAQRQKASAYVASNGGEIIAEYSEHESGKKDDRPELAKAIEHMKATGATLLIAKLDRLSRNVAFLFQLKEKLDKLGLKAIAIDYPEVMQSTMMLGILSTMAQQERELISERTKAALAVKKAQGVKLGGLRGENMDKAWQASVIAKKSAALEWAKSVSPVILKLRSQGTPLNQIAQTMNEQRTPTRKGGKWTATTVKRILTLCESK